MYLCIYLISENEQFYDRSIRYRNDFIKQVFSALRARIGATTLCMCRTLQLYISFFYFRVAWLMQTKYNIEC